MKSRDLQQHIASTYACLRVGVVVLSVLLPFILWLGGLQRAGLPLQDSMSAYYHASDGAMRDVFVGFLFAVGACLVLYKGYTFLEDMALNLAGVLLTLVALVPMSWGAGDSDRFSWHGFFAITFFICIGYVAIFRASDTLSLIPDSAKARRYRRAYLSIGLIGMLVCPLAAAGLSLLLQAGSEIKSWKFAAEAAAVFSFSLYWLIKSLEIRHTNAEKTAIEGKLIVRQVGMADLFRQVPVEFRGTP